MKYCLGLDLGVGSIGSAVVELDKNNNPENIADAGVRIFEVSEGAEERRTKRTARKNLIRTRKRLELLAQKLYENNLWVSANPEGTNNLKSKSPYKIRYDALNGKLENQNYIGRAILHLAKHRGAGFVSAAEEMEEEVLEEGEKSKKKPTAYELMANHLKEKNSRTIGEFFYKRILESYEINEQTGEHEKVKLRTVRQKVGMVDYAIPRYLVKDEFKQIWDKQAEYFPQMQKEGLKQEIYDILFYERPAAPYATGKCIYFRDEDRLLKAHPLSEMRRIYEEVNNVSVLSDTSKRHLTIAERDKIVNELLLQGKNAGCQSIKKVLNLSGQKKLSIDEKEEKQKPIKAYLYSRPEFAQVDYIKNLSQDELIKFTEFLGNPVNPDDKQGRLYNEDEVIAKLKPILGIDDEKQIAKLLTMLPKGRVMLGISATKKILDKLKSETDENGYVLGHRKITDKLAKDDKHFMAAEEIARQNQGKCFELPYYGKILQTDTQSFPPLVLKNNHNLNEDEKQWGKVANPAVHMILNQIRLVVNEIIKIYGRPYEIHIELGRDVGLSTKNKNSLEKMQKANEKLNEEAKKYLLEHKIYVNGKNILKWKLAQEQGWVDAYNPTQEIDRRFIGFEIEHIIPQSRGGTDTYNNLCLVSRADNEAKGNDFAYDYFVKSKDPEMIGAILNNARTKLKNKAWRFEADAREKFEDEGDKEETNRYMTDTRYVSKLAARYLRAIIDCSADDGVIENRILAVKGGQTAELRKRWNLQGLEYDLMGLNIPRYIDCAPYWQNLETGEIIDGEQKPDIDGNWKFYNCKKNPEWSAKPRIDHRHHAMDAITVACCNWNMIRQMANETDLHKIKVPLPMTSVQSVGEFRRKVIDVLKEVNVSHKPDHNKLGQFHEETGKVKLGINPDNPDNLITVYSRKILQVVKTYKDLDKMLIPDSVKDSWHEEIAENRVRQAKLVADFKQYWNLAEQILLAENEKDMAEGKKERKITEGLIIAKTFHILLDKKFMGEKVWKGDKFKCYENVSSYVYVRKHNLVYKSGNNHCVDFYEKDSKVGWEVVKRFDVNKDDFVPQWKKDGGKLIWSVQQRDMLELDTPDEWKSYTDKERCLAKVKKFSDGRLTIDYMTDARMTSPKDKNLKYMFVDSVSEKGLSFFIKHKARKIELTPFGKVKKKHKVLWNGAKTAA